MKYVCVLLLIFNNTGMMLVKGAPHECSDASIEPGHIFVRPAPLPPSPVVLGKAAKYLLVFLAEYAAGKVLDNVFFKDSSLKPELEKLQRQLNEYIPATNNELKGLDRKLDEERQRSSDGLTRLEIQTSAERRRLEAAIRLAYEELATVNSILNDRPTYADVRLMVNEVLDQVAKNRMELNELGVRVNDIEDQIEIVNQKLSVHDKKLNDINHRIDKLGDRVTDVTNRVDAVEETVGLYKTGWLVGIGFTYQGYKFKENEDVADVNNDLRSGLRLEVGYEKDRNSFIANYSTVEDIEFVDTRTTAVYADLGINRLAFNWDHSLTSAQGLHIRLGAEHQSATFDPVGPKSYDERYLLGGFGLGIGGKSRSNSSSWGLIGDWHYGKAELSLQENRGEPFRQELDTDSIQVELWFQWRSQSQWLGLRGSLFYEQLGTNWEEENYGTLYSSKADTFGVSATLRFLVR